MDKVAIVILNWNGEKFLKKYLPALVANTPTAIGGEGGGSTVSIVVADIPLNQLLRNGICVKPC